MLAKVTAREHEGREKLTRTNAVSTRDGAADVVRRYAAAKSRQDVEGALAVCTDDFILDTVGFGIRGVGRDVVALQLGTFFANETHRRRPAHTLADNLNLCLPGEQIE